MAETRDTQGRAEQKEQGRGLQRTESGASDRLRRLDPFESFSMGPFALMRRMQEDMDRLFGDIGSGTGRQWPSLWSQGGRADWTPAVETFQRGNEFVVRAEIPGLSPDDISVEIGEDALTLQGEKKSEHQEEREGVFRSERSYGSFYRVVPLPEGAVTDSAKANFKNGVLEIVMQAPSQEVRRGRRIEIGQESTSGEKAKERR
jgi:HSP20 family protein